MPREVGPHTVFAAKFEKTICGFQKFIFWPHWFFVNKNISILEYHTKNRSRKNPIKPIFFVNFIRIDYLLKLTAMIMFVGMPYIYWKKSIPTINCPVLCSLTAKLHPDAYLSGCLFFERIRGARQHLSGCPHSAPLTRIPTNINKQCDLSGSTALKNIRV